MAWHPITDDELDPAFTDLADRALAACRVFGAGTATFTAYDDNGHTLGACTVSDIDGRYVLHSLTITPTDDGDQVETVVACYDDGETEPVYNDRPTIEVHDLLGPDDWTPPTITSNDYTTPTVEPLDRQPLG